MGLSLDSSHHSLEEIVDFLIIGGGVAGLSAANRLCDLGRVPVIVEAGSYPMHKVCGEFLSPEALPLLAHWSIQPHCPIVRAHFFAGQQEFVFPLPVQAGSLARYELDASLVRHAQERGACFLCRTQVVALTQKEEGGEPLYFAELSSGKTVRARNIFVGSGRLTSQKQLGKPFVPRFFGFKAHFSGLDLDQTLQMYALPGAYLGISNIDQNVVNVAGLVKVDATAEAPQEWIERLLNQKGAARLKETLSGLTRVYPEWMTVYAPSFGQRTLPDWPNAYFIGEAAGTIPPATGDGLGMAITSGVMAADYALQKDWRGFKKAWHKRYGPRIAAGKFLHEVISRPSIATLAMRASRLFPLLARTLFSMTRE